MVRPHSLKPKLVPLLAALLLTLAAPLSALDLTLGTQVGYQGGFSLRGSGTIDGFAKGFPLSIEVALGAALQEPGSAAEARRIFINDNTNGSPEEYGLDLVGRLDFWYDTKWLKEGRVFLGGGPRYSGFRAHFKYVGGNEEFDITSNQWGLGGGVKGSFDMSSKWDFLLGAGLDYFFDAPLDGHTRIYKPNGNDVDPRNGESYSTADGAIDQPKWSPSVMVGVGYHW